MKDIILLGGPHGAGKTTAARSLLPDELGIRIRQRGRDRAKSLDLQYGGSRACRQTGDD